MHHNSTLCQVRRRPGSTPVRCEICEQPEPIWLLWFTGMPYALCGGCSAGARDVLGACGQDVGFLPVLTVGPEEPALRIPDASCPNCGSTRIGWVGDDERTPADASGLFLCHDCLGIVGVLA